MVNVGSKRSCMVCRLGPGIISFVDKRLERGYSSRSLAKSIKGLTRTDIDRHKRHPAARSEEKAKEEEKSANESEE
jgi:hypothetical protein